MTSTVSPARFLRITSSLYRLGVSADHFQNGSETAADRRRIAAPPAPMWMSAPDWPIRAPSS